MRRTRVRAGGPCRYAVRPTGIRPGTDHNRPFRRRGRRKQAITKADYVKLNEACSRKGLAIQLTSARMDGTDRAVVIAKQLVAAQKKAASCANA